MNRQFLDFFDSLFFMIQFIPDLLHLLLVRELHLICMLLCWFQISSTSVPYVHEHARVIGPYALFEQVLVGDPNVFEGARFLLNAVEGFFD